MALGSPLSEALRLRMTCRNHLMLASFPSKSQCCKSGLWPLRKSTSNRSQLTRPH